MWSGGVPRRQRAVAAPGRAARGPGCWPMNSAQPLRAAAPPRRSRSSPVGVAPTTSRLVGSSAQLVARAGGSPACSSTGHRRAGVAVEGLGRRRRRPGRPRRARLQPSPMQRPGAPARARPRRHAGGRRIGPDGAADRAPSLSLAAPGRCAGRPSCRCPGTRVSVDGRRRWRRRGARSSGRVHRPAWPGRAGARRRWRSAAARRPASRRRRRSRTGSASPRATTRLAASRASSPEPQAAEGARRALHAPGRPRRPRPRRSSGASAAPTRPPHEGDHPSTSCASVRPRWRPAAAAGRACRRARRGRWPARARRRRRPGLGGGVEPQQPR